MHQKWKEMTGEFSKKSKTNTEKTYEKYGKISDVFWKNSNVFQEISYVFSGTRRYYPNLKRVTSRGEV